MSVLFQTRPYNTSRQGGLLWALAQQLLAKVGVRADAGYARVGALAHEATGTCKHTIFYCVFHPCYTNVSVVVLMQRAPSQSRTALQGTGSACVDCPCKQSCC